MAAVLEAISGEETGNRHEVLESRLWEERMCAGMVREEVKVGAEGGLASIETAAVPIAVEVG